MENRVENLVKTLDLLPHPEGGWFQEIYRSPITISPSGFNGSRSLCTSIYYLLVQDNFSTFHRIQSDEIWHHYEGDNIRIVALSPDQKKYEWILGQTGKNIRPNIIVPARWWFAAEIVEGSMAIDRDDRSASRFGYSLVGCTVSPGFDFHDFQIADRAELLIEYPEYITDIIKLTR